MRKAASKRANNACQQSRKSKKWVSTWERRGKTDNLYQGGQSIMVTHLTLYEYIYKATLLFKMEMFS